MPETPPRVFISYSRTDSDFVDRLEANLQSGGFRTWVDRRKLESGQDWVDQLQDAIDQCHVLLVVLSPDAVKSKYVRMEYRYALDQGKLVIPLEYQPPPKVPIDLYTIQRIMFHSGYDQGLQSLLQTLKRVSGPAAPPLSTASEQQKQPDKQPPAQAKAGDEAKKPVDNKAGDSSQKPVDDAATRTAPQEEKKAGEQTPEPKKPGNYANDPTHFSDFFETLFGRGSPNAAKPRQRQGDHIEQPVTISLQEAYSGGTRKFVVKFPEVCATCQGIGEVNGKQCTTCQGQGEIAHYKRIEVRIPLGVDNGSRVRVAGEGQPGIGGGPRGDLFLVVTVTPQAGFTRAGDDLFTTTPIDKAVAEQGGEVPVVLPDNRRLLLTIPPGTANGQEFRLTGKGMVNLKTGNRGNLFVKVRVPA